MKTIAIRAMFLAAASLWALSSPAIESDRAASTELRYEMAVGADGRATSLKPINPLPDEVDQKIQQRVRSFRFEPATVNGIPQPATTTLYLTLGPIALADGTAGYGITDLGTGPRKLANQTRETPPPRSEAGYLVVTYDRSGRVVDIQLEEAGSPTTPRFRKWAMALAKSFKFVPETVAGIALPAKIRVRLVFCNGGSRNCADLLPASNEKALGGDMIADSVLKLKSPLGEGSI